MKTALKGMGIAAGLYAFAYFAAAFFKKPPQDSSDWAAWVQAVGSIGAIGVAIWLSHSSEREARRQAVQSGRIFAGKLLNCLGQLQKACANQNYGEISAEAVTLEELVEFGRRLRLDVLTAQEAWALFDIRALAVGAANLVDQTKNTTSLNHAGGEFHNIRMKVLEAVGKYDSGYE